MKFIATLTHEPANCWARGENRQKARTWLAEMEERAREDDITLRCAYVTPTEHTFHIVLESDSYEAVTELLGAPLLEDHEGHIAPVLSLLDDSTPVFDR